MLEGVPSDADTPVKSSLASSHTVAESSFSILGKASWQIFVVVGAGSCCVCECTQPKLTCCTSNHFAQSSDCSLRKKPLSGSYLHDN